jgi:hypothetical protein
VSRDWALPAVLERGPWLISGGLFPRDSAGRDVKKKKALFKERLFSLPFAVMTTSMSRLFKGFSKALIPSVSLWLMLLCYIAGWRALWRNCTDTASVVLFRRNVSGPMFPSNVPLASWITLEFINHSFLQSAWMYLCDKTLWNLRKNAYKIWKVLSIFYAFKFYRIWT